MNYQNILVQKSIQPSDVNGYPVVFKCGKGAFLYDMKYEKYIDFMNCKGSIILGHNPDYLVTALIDFLRLGMDVRTGFNEAMLKLTCQINKALGYDKMAYFKTGTEAVKAAMIAVQAYNGKKIVLSSGYHGYDLMWKFSGKIGHPNQDGIIDFFFDLEMCAKLIDRYKREISSVIISPDPLYLTKDWFIKLNDLVKNNNILLIVDEVKVGFRYNFGLYTSCYGLKPDLAVISKGIANGFPISAVCGYKGIMEGCSTFNYTCFFDSVTFFVATTVMDALNKKGFYETLNQVSLNLISIIKSLIAQFELPIKVKHNGSIFQFIFSDEEASDTFFYESIQYGLIFYPGDNQCFSYSFNDKKVHLALKQCLANLFRKIKKNPLFKKERKPTLEWEIKTAWNLMDGLPDIAIDKKLKEKVLKELPE